MRIVKRLGQHLYPVAYRRYGATLQVLNAADIPRYDAIGPGVVKRSDFAIAQAMRNLRLKDRVGSCRPTTKMDVFPGQPHVEAQRA